MEPNEPGSGGGTIDMIRMVTRFYSKVLSSPLLEKYFAGVPMEVLIAKQAAFIDTIVRGDPGYSAAALRQLHAHLNVDDKGFDELLRILDDSLREQRIEPDMSSVIQHSFASYRHAIVAGAGT